MQRLEFSQMAQFFQPTSSTAVQKVQVSKRCKKRMQCFDHMWIKEQADLAGISFQVMRRELIQ